ncbi:DUF1566 domain-containing protein [Ferruginibacter sp. SUN106]|uniref:Lcl domain-containing protein n=1 Tax=Ferruginibacter sp. SUN106 TaxID=2978348 RepID=UPI003D35B835
MKNYKSIIPLSLIVVLFLSATAGCKKNSKDTPIVHAIGDSFQGGRVAYILQSGDVGFDANIQHGIIIATTDQSTTVTWGPNSVSLIGTETSVGSGNDNTNKIVSAFGAGNYAARLCYDLGLNGYTDWYLPSKDELNKLYLNKAAIGGFANYRYWASSEDAISTAWREDMALGLVAANSRPGLYYVRAVRSF